MVAPAQVLTADPRGGAYYLTDIHESTPEVVANACRLAATAAPEFEAVGREGRARFLRGIADELEAEREVIVASALRETGLPDARLHGELTRTTFQMRFFADVIEEGSYLEATIDHAGDTPMGPGPDLRRMLVAIGPVAVFGASNFPMAFSVPGGDTASALAAGSPVVVKDHESHPLTSALCLAAMERAAAATGMPAGVVGAVYGRAAGAVLVADPRIKAVGFTGSLGGGEALMTLIAQRDEPIPFYGELASVNPVIVTPAAAAARGDAIAAGLHTSITASAGQLCTKPGLVFVPSDAAGDVLVDTLRRLLADTDAAVVLNERIFNSYNDTRDTTAKLDVVGRRTEGREPSQPGWRVRAAVVEVDAAALHGPIAQECFGPFAVVVGYTDDDELDEALDALEASLTATIHAEPEETARVSALSTRLRPKAGRLIYNGYPTGLLVSWAQSHGGPWPSTNSIHTSVGATAIRRFLRPVTWQDAPESVLPIELRDGSTSVVRRVDGQLTIPPID
jgi:NADP-dependent aldehyde dehydrogenase